MPMAQARSVKDIRTETEATRASLSETVEELRGAVSGAASEIRERLKPDSIRAEASDYVRTKSASLFNELKRTAERNPVQALAIGASVAYPLLRVARAVPLPALLIGAGVFLTSTKTGRALTEQASDAADGVADSVRHQVNDAGKHLSHVVEDATQSVGDVLTNVRGAAQTARDTVAEATESATAHVTSLKESALRTAAASADRFKSGGADGLSAVDAAARKSASATNTLLEDAGDRIGSTAREAKRSIGNAVEESPLLVAGLGLLLGGFIANAFPSSSTEERLFGSKSDAIKTKTKAAAASGLEAARNAAGNVLHSIEESAKSEGLTSSDMSRGVRAVTEKLQVVADRGITAALEPSAEERSESNKSQDGEDGGQYG